MKKYLLFTGDTYYPSGGWDDFVDDFDSIEEALAYAAKNGRDWFHIVDTEIKRIIRY